MLLRQLQLWLENRTFGFEYPKMVNGSWISFQFTVSCQNSLIENDILRRISEYSTAHSTDAAYIIGGTSTPNLVAQFKDDQWHKLDDLKQGRYRHGSITIGGETMIIGGYAIKEWVFMDCPGLTICQENYWAFIQCASWNGSLGTWRWEEQSDRP